MPVETTRRADDACENLLLEITDEQMHENLTPGEYVNYALSTQPAIRSLGLAVGTPIIWRKLVWERLRCKMLEKALEQAEAYGVP